MHIGINAGKLVEWMATRQFDIWYGCGKRGGVRYWNPSITNVEVHMCPFFITVQLQMLWTFTKQLRNLYIMTLAHTQQFQYSYKEIVNYMNDLHVTVYVMYGTKWKPLLGTTYASNLDKTSSSRNIFCQRAFCKGQISITLKPAVILTLSTTLK